MSPVTCIIVDDEQFAVDMLSAYVHKTNFLKLLHATTSPLEALEWAPKAQLIITDIDMPELTGIDLLKVLAGRMKFILCTAHPEFAVTGFDYEVVDYLLKPVTYARFFKAADKARIALQPSALSLMNDTIFLQAQGKGSYLKLQLEDIVLVEAEKNYVIFHAGGKKHIVNSTMKQAQAQLPAAFFMRVHNSFIINIKAIEIIKGNTVKLAGRETSVAISAAYKPALLQALGITGRTEENA